MGFISLQRLLWVFEILGSAITYQMELLLKIFIPSALFGARLGEKIVYISGKPVFIFIFSLYIEFSP